MKKIIFSILIITITFPFPALSASFNLNLVISDMELTDPEAMSLDRVQRFLENKGSYLKDYKTQGVTGTLKSAAEIIYEAAKYYGLSPKYFLVRVQVEQSLIFDPSPTQRQLNQATGYGCPDYSTCDPDYSGFFNQINQSAKAIVGIKYLEGIEKNGTTISGWGPGITKTTLDGIEITPVNAATAVLYTYTPWVGKYGGGDQRFGGTSLFAKLWQEWFTRSYPDGSLLQDSNTGAVYLIQNGKKRPFWSRAAFLANYNSAQIILVTLNELDAYEDNTPIRYPENSLLQSPDGGVYLLSKGKKRAINSREIFREIGFNPEEILQVSWEELRTLPDGEKITRADNYPQGALIQSTSTGGIFYVESGVRHPIWSREIMNSNYHNRSIIPQNDTEIEKFTLGDPIKFKDGELVTSPGTGSVYVISNGQKRRFANADVFLSLGYKWDNVIMTTDRALEIHSDGNIINQ